MFTTLNNRNLTLSGKKAFLGFLSLTLLGQYVDGLGLSTTAEKIATIKDLSFLTTLKDLETYLRITG